MEDATRQETVETTEEMKAPPTQQEARRFTQAEVDAANAATRRETDRKARESKEREISESLGVSVDEAKELISRARRQEEASKSELDKALDKAGKLESDLKANKDASKAEKERAERYEMALKGYLEKEREGISEHLTVLLDRMDVVEQLVYISENRAVLKPEETRPETRRAPDATRRSTIDDKLTPRELISSAFAKR